MEPQSPNVPCCTYRLTWSSLVRYLHALGMCFDGAIHKTDNPVHADIKEPVAFVGVSLHVDTTGVIRHSEGLDSWFKRGLLRDSLRYL